MRKKVFIFRQFQISEYYKTNNVIGYNANIQIVRV